MGTWDQIRGMGEPELRALLSSSDPRERIHAVWALGLRASDPKLFADALAGEPQSGVRRVLAVVLAGMGELDLLVALARHDPDVYVRAHASQIVVRFAHAGRIPWEIVVERFDDERDVRAAMLGYIEADAPQAIVDRIVLALDDRDGRVRSEAFETAVKLYRAARITSEPLERLLDGATAGEVKNALVFWFRIDEPRSIAKALACATERVRSAALRMRPELALTELAPLIERDPELFEALAQPLHLTLANAPIGLVIRVAKRARRGEQLVEAEACLAASSRLPQLAVELAELHAACVAAMSEIDATLGSPSMIALDYYGEQPEDLWLRRATLEAVAAHALRLR